MLRVPSSHLINHPPPTSSIPAWPPCCDWTPCAAPLGFNGSRKVRGEHPKTTPGHAAPPAPRLLTRLAADLVVAVAARVEPRRVAALVPGHLDGVFLEPPDEPLHQTELDEPPGGGRGERDVMLSPQMSPPPPACCPSPPASRPRMGLRPLVHPLQLQGVAGDEVSHRRARAEATVQLENVTEAGSFVPCGDETLSAATDGSPGTRTPHGSSVPGLVT